METLETKNTPKKRHKYSCEKCAFGCSKLSDYKRHVTTRKHQMETMETQKTQKNAKLYQCDCGQVYKNRSGLWKHSQKCNYEELEEENTKIVESPPSEQSLIIEVLKSICFFLR